MAPSHCSMPNCSFNLIKNRKIRNPEDKISIFVICNPKYLPRNTAKFYHHESLNKFILRYRDSNSSFDKIKSQLHKNQAGICELHFNREDIIQTHCKNGRIIKNLKIGAMPTKNLPIKCISKHDTTEVSKTTSAAYHYGEKVYFENFNQVISSAKKFQEDNESWKISISDETVCATFWKNNAMSDLEITIFPDMSYKVYSKAWLCPSFSVVYKTMFRIHTFSHFLNEMLQFKQCVGCINKPAVWLVEHVFIYKDENGHTVYETFHRSKHCEILFRKTDGLTQCQSCYDFDFRFKELKEKKKNSVA